MRRLLLRPLGPADAGALLADFPDGAAAHLRDIVLPVKQQGRGCTGRSAGLTPLECAERIKAGSGQVRAVGCSGATDLEQARDAIGIGTPVGAHGSISMSATPADGRRSGPGPCPDTAT